ncbi:GAF domain-containing protein [Streptomyces sp. MST-110588]|nr:GAF domain-containing protein [Streptomyces sp. MST-110588]UNO43122.1 GAF domain-containing protein [Streptomyces sp. MST-110588]
MSRSCSATPGSAAPPPTSWSVWSSTSSRPPSSPPRSCHEPPRFPHAICVLRPDASSPAHSPGRRGPGAGRPAACPGHRGGPAARLRCVRAQTGPYDRGAVRHGQLHRRAPAVLRRALHPGERPGARGTRARAAERPAGRVMARDHGYCPHVIVRRKALVLEDVCDYPRFAGNPVVDEIGIRSYLGAPLIDRTGTALGTVCVVDLEPRPWGREGLDTIKTMAAELVEQIHCMERRLTSEEP